MPRDILTEIIDRRKSDMERLGLEFGCPVPETRQRKIHPFIQEKGAILEIKRASPSKGDIAPGLDAGVTAVQYAKAGARAISCLTETNYFKGTLNDFMKAAAALDEYEAANPGVQIPALLRKDFLISAAEVEVAYRAGADAVLLIARILAKETMLEMAQKCAGLGISALIEVRKEADLEKLAFVMNQVDHKYIVCGVNSRDLKDFTIDMLSPAGMLDEIRKIASDARVTFESGILTPQSAAFAGSMGFSAILLGEAAAKNPDKAVEFTKAFESTAVNKAGQAWTEYAASLHAKKLPLVKICGITKAEDAVLAAELGADFLGFIFWKKSKRCTDADSVRNIKKVLAEKYGDAIPEFVGVIVELGTEESDAAISLVREGVLDKIQFHGFKVPDPLEKEFADIPRYAAVNVSSIEDIPKLKDCLLYGEPRVLVDAQISGMIGGTGKRIDGALVKEVQKEVKLWLAGGITPDNVAEVVESYEPELIDIASGVESEPGIKDHGKLKALFQNLTTHRSK